MTIRQVLTAAAGLVVIGAAAGCGQLPAGQQGAAHSGTGQQSTDTSASSSVLAPTEVYYIPAKPKTGPGTLYQHKPGAARSADILLGRADDPLVVPATAPAAAVSSHLQFFATGRSAETMATSAAMGAPTQSILSTTSAATSLDLGSISYLQAGQDVVAMSRGHVVGSYRLPVLHLDHSAGGLPRGYKGLFSGTGVGQVSALVPTRSGHVLAFSATGFGAGVTDLMTGRTVVLKGYASLGSAVRARDGNIYVMAWRANQQRFPIHVLKLNGSTYAVERSMSTGILPANYLRDTMVVGSGPQAVVAIARGTTQAGVTLSLVQVFGQRVTDGPALPHNIGLNIAVAAPGRLFIYGGPARNTVSLLTLSSGALQRNLASLRTRPGSFIVGLLPA